MEPLYHPPAHSLQNGFPDPQKKLKLSFSFKPIFDYNKILSLSHQLHRRIWRILSAIEVWFSALLSKISSSFKSLIQSNHKSIEKSELHLTKSLNAMIPDHRLELDSLDDEKPVDDNIYPELFELNFSYEKYSYNILSAHFNGISYNNYNYLSFFNIKNHNKHILKECKNKAEFDLKTSMIVYDSIKNLYLERFYKKYPDMKKEKYLPSLSFIALGVAIKLSLDCPMWNTDLRSFLPKGVSLTEETHMRMEVSFLNAIEWDTSTQELEIEK